MSDKQTAILIGAAVAGLTGVSYFSFINTACCLGVIIGGIVATQQYVSRTGNAKVETRDGAIMGAAAGAIGSLLGSVMDLALSPIGLDSQSISEGFSQSMMESMQGGQSEQFQSMMQQQGEMGIGMYLVLTVLGIVVWAIFGAIGGTIGAALFGKEEGSA